MEKAKENKYQVSIDLMNDAVGKEIAASLQYIYFHVHFEDERYEYLARICRAAAIAEMRHIEQFAERILFLEGDVEMNPSFVVKPLTEPDEMLAFAIQLEESTIEHYNAASVRAAEHFDTVTQRLFQDIIAEEERHLDLFRTELQSLRDFGDDYLVQQTTAGSRAAAKRMEKEAD